MFERKYKIDNDKIVKKSNGVPIPEDEPLFIFRAKDKYALSILLAYHMILEDLDQRSAVANSINDFKEFARNNPEKMTEPKLG